MELAISGIKFEHFELVDGCFEYSEKKRDIDLYVIDIMLATRDEPSSRYNRNNTMNFLFTGCVLARELREMGVTAPIIFFTATSRIDALEEIHRQAKEIGNCALLRKVEMEAAFDFRDVIQSVLNGGLAAASSRKWFEWLYESALLQLNVAGIGVDGKVLVKGPKTKLKS